MSEDPFDQVQGQHNFPKCILNLDVFWRSGLEPGPAESVCLCAYVCV